MHANPSSRSHPPLAVLRAASKRYGDVRALDSLDLQVGAGELVALLGPNGAGKTTSVKLLLGLIRPDRGQVSVFGQQPSARAARMRCGCMLQVAQVPENLRVREHIELFRSYYPSPLSMDRILELAGLESIAERLSGKLSGGQSQRLMFALAICGDPDLMFLDEPTVGLDVKSRRQFWASIRSFVADGKGVVLTTHYLEEADALADRVVVIDQGRLLAEGRTEEIKSQFTARRIQCLTQLDDGVLQGLAGVIEYQRSGPQLSLLSERPEQTVRELLTRDPDLSDLQVQGVGLEEAFLKITGAAGLERAA